MGMTMTQKILAEKAGQHTVAPGDLIMAELDLVMGNDITAPVAVNEMEKYGLQKLFDPQKVVFVLDHFTPNKDIRAAQNCQLLRAFARRAQMPYCFDVGTMGIEHCLLPEQGFILPGEAIIGADSHTCTYGAMGAFATGVGSTDMAYAMAHGRTWFRVPSAIRFHLAGAVRRPVSGKDVILYIIGLIGVDGALYQSMEFSGEGLSSLCMDDRFTIANMAVEAGAKNAIFPVDEQTLAYIGQLGGISMQRNYRIYTADEDAAYDAVYEIDLSKIPLLAACPHLPSNVRPVAELNGVPIDQAVIGSCTNGRLHDLRIAAEIMRSRRVAPGVRCIVIPGTQQIYLQALREGLLEIFIQAGAAVSTPTCGPCLGGHMGILAKGERAVSTTNRNFVGRMGHTESEVYLTGPAVAAASAIAGFLCEPQTA